MREADGERAGLENVVQAVRRRERPLGVQLDTVALGTELTGERCRCFARSNTRIEKAHDLPSLDGRSGQLVGDQPDDVRGSWETAGFGDRFEATHDRPLPE